MLGEIGNKELLRAVGNALGVVDQKIAPGNLDTDRVVVTMPLGIGWANYTQQDLSTAFVARGGNPSLTWEPIGAGAGAQSPGVDPFGFVLSSGFEWLITGLSVDVRLDAAGAVADAGKFLVLTMSRTSPGVGAITNVVGQFERWDVISAGRLDYIFSWPTGILNPRGAAGPLVLSGSRPIWVPDGSRFTISVAYEDGTNFAANTQIKGTATLVRTPGGIPPPGL